MSTPCPVGLVAFGGRKYCYTPPPHLYKAGDALAAFLQGQPQQPFAPEGDLLQVIIDDINHFRSKHTPQEETCKP